MADMPLPEAQAGPPVSSEHGLARLFSDSEVKCEINCQAGPPP
jgi:hypothetical protein